MRSLTALLVLVISMLTPLPGTAWAGRDGATEDNSIYVAGEVREVNHLQQTVRLKDGTMLRATDPQQLKGLGPGAKIKAHVEQRADRKFITQIEQVLP